jgi:hypothetical protein
VGRRRTQPSHQSWLPIGFGRSWCIRSRASGVRAGHDTALSGQEDLEVTVSTVSININEAPVLGLSRRHQRPRTRAKSAALSVTIVLLASWANPPRRIIGA